MKWYLGDFLYVKQILKIAVSGWSSALMRMPSQWRTMQITAAAVAISVTATIVIPNAHGAEGPLIALPSVGFPTGITYAASRKAVLFADYDGAIYSMRQDSARIAEVARVKVTDCSRVLRLQADATRNRLWVMSASGICVYSLDTMQLVRHLTLAGISHNPLANRLSDLALDAQGNAYVIDSAMDPIIYRIGVDSFSAEVWKEGSGNKETLIRGTGVYSPEHIPLNAIAIAPPGDRLLYVNAYNGTLHSLDITSGQRSAISLSSKLYAANALVAVRAAKSAGGTDIYVFSASNNSVLGITLTDSPVPAHARVFATRFLDQPMAAVWVGDVLLVTNSQLLRHPKFIDTRPAKARPSSIARLNRTYFAEHSANPIIDAVLAP